MFQYKGDKYSRNNSMFLPMNRTYTFHMNVFLPLVVVVVGIVASLFSSGKCELLYRCASQACTQPHKDIYAHTHTHNAAKFFVFQPAERLNEGHEPARKRECAVNRQKDEEKIMELWWPNCVRCLFHLLIF